MREDLASWPHENQVDAVPPFLRCSHDRRSSSIASADHQHIAVMEGGPSVLRVALRRDLHEALQSEAPLTHVETAQGGHPVGVLCVEARGLDDDADTDAPNQISNRHPR